MIATELFQREIAMSRPLRLGRINFVNILPVHLHLTANPALFQEIPGVPSALNRMLRSGELDVSVVSSVEYALHSDEYLLLPDLSISAAGKVGSVLLFSDEFPQHWKDRPIEAPFESDTSVALIRVLLKYHWQIEADLVGEGEAPDLAAVLRIGDRALEGAVSGKWAHIYDMGQQWLELTGLPFVFAVWAVRRDVAQRWPGEVRALHQALLASRDQGVAELCSSAEEAAKVMGRQKPDMLAYYRLLHYGLGQEYRQGLERFFDYLTRLGIINAAPETVFFNS